MKTIAPDQQFLDPLGTLQIISAIKAGGNEGLRQKMNDMPKEQAWINEVNNMEIFKVEDPSL
jgi:hypothetical protein